MTTEQTQTATTDSSAPDVTKTVHGKGQYLLLLNPLKIKVEEGHNPRRDFGDLDALAGSIGADGADGKPVGVKVPLLVRKDGSDYVLVDGERRLRAIKQLGDMGVSIWSVPAIVEEDATTPEDRLLTAMRTNDGKPLTFGEESEAYLRLKKGGMTATAIAARIGRDIAYVTARINFAAKATPEVKELVAAGKLAPSVAAATVQKAAKAKGDVTAAVKGEVAKVRTTKDSGAKAKGARRNLKGGDGGVKPEPIYKRLGMDALLKQIAIAKEMGLPDVARGLKIALGAEKPLSSLAAKLEKEVKPAAAKAEPKKDEGKEVANFHFGKGNPKAAKSEESARASGTRLAGMAKAKASVQAAKAASAAGKNVRMR